MPADRNESNHDDRAAAKAKQKKEERKIKARKYKDPKQAGDSPRKILTKLKIRVSNFMRRVKEMRNEDDSLFLWLLGVKVTGVEDHELTSLEPLWPYTKPASMNEHQLQQHIKRKQITRSQMLKRKRYMYMYAYFVPEARAYVSSRIYNSIIAKLPNESEAKDPDSTDIGADTDIEIKEEPDVLLQIAQHLIESTK
ncbi:hypothetical protein BDF22DRAFT_744125 [Syncephalis plumigaleata]|nr:hypothetical protein BDF22DRAFT_744125 [Syncephalis plumigaleata]